MGLTNRKLVLKIEKGTTFTKKFRWKNKYKEPINLYGFDFKSQFRYDFGDDKVLCTLTVDNGGIVVNPSEGEIEIIITSDITSTLNNYDSGMWSIEYRQTTGENFPFKTLIKGRWVVEPEVTV
jgi:hypothetical protein